MANQFKGFACGCCVACTIASDNFDRADTGDLSPQWRPDSLDSFNGWEIVSNRLKPGSGVYLEFNTEDPEDPADDGIRWSAVLNFGGATGRKRLYVDRVDDSNFHFAEVQCTDSTSATLRLWKREGGSDTALSAAEALSGFDWSTDLTLAVCWGFQGVVPACSGGTLTWVWTADYFGPGLDGWQPRDATGACQDYLCGSATPPPITGFESYGDEEVTGCGPTLGGEGDTVFGITATVNDSQGVSDSATALGGTIVALSAVDCGTGARFDDAKLARLKPSCPGCVPDCNECTDGQPEQVQVDLEGEFIDGTCTNCDALFLGSYICNYVGRCEWRYYFPSGYCDYDYLRVLLVSNGIIVNMIRDDGVDDNFWNTPSDGSAGTLITPINCATLLDRYEVPRGTGRGERCNGRGRTDPDRVRCYVTAL